MTFHNPGATTSQARRERLLALCESRGIPIVEDAFEGEVKAHDTDQGCQRLAGAPQRL